MSDFRKALSTHVSEADWQLMAQSSGQTVDELKEAIIPTLEALARGDDKLVAQLENQGVTVDLADAVTDGSCESQKFEVSLFKIIGLKGELKLCGTGASDWSAELKTCITAAEVPVWCTTYKFDPHNLRVCYSINLGFAKVDICFTLQLKHDKICLNIKGEACIWGFGWKCGKFDITPFCIPLP